MRKGKKIVVHGDGTSLWSLTHAEDFANGFIGLLGHQQAIGHAFHITSDEILTWNQIYQAIAETINVETKIVHVPSDLIIKFDKSLIGNLLGDKSHSVIFDNSKIKSFVPDFKAVIPFKQGIKRTLSWFEADLSRQIIKKETNDMIDKIIYEFEKITA
jgi:nucleoside-diphosphate-sugar epimerase